LMNIAASFPSVKKPRYIDHEKSRQYDWRWCFIV
jgi:hypothetical protein